MNLFENIGVAHLTEDWGNLKGIPPMLLQALNNWKIGRDSKVEQNALSRFTANELNAVLRKSDVQAVIFKIAGMPHSLLRFGSYDENIIFKSVSNYLNREYSDDSRTAILKDMKKLFGDLLTADVVYDDKVRVQKSKDRAATRVTNDPLDVPLEHRLEKYKASKHNFETFEDFKQYATTKATPKAFKIGNQGFKFRGQFMSNDIIGARFRAIDDSYDTITVELQIKGLKLVPVGVTKNF